MPSSIVFSDLAVHGSGENLQLCMGGRAASREEQICHEPLPALQVELVEHQSQQPIELALGARQQAAMGLSEGLGCPTVCVLCSLARMLSRCNTLLCNSTCIACQGFRQL